MFDRVLNTTLHSLNSFCRRKSPFQLFHDGGLLSYRNWSIDLRSKSMDWFLYDRNLHYETVKEKNLNPCQTSKMQLFVKIVNDFESLTVSPKSSILDAWQDSGYVSNLQPKNKFKMHVCTSYYMISSIVSQIFSHFTYFAICFKKSEVTTQYEKRREYLTSCK